MRTTVNLDEDITTVVTRLRREHGLGVSEAVNELARAGLAAATAPRKRVRLKARGMNMRVNVSNIAEALEAAEQPGT